ncbi:ZnF C2H2 [Emericellopsis cladophorae]|uniref:ZnF C2H2 n=1 Tax=Emericellopsis cladophorae TaxID=2686198 RepID=A0A9P9Y6C6_9HYPO|nr:ZnF C2H2 [Emericellopsis cladophorae]KAI6783893.1 ZnF C2H2 [Emericellopsis cladophorae]
MARLDSSRSNGSSLSQSSGTSSMGVGGNAAFQAGSQGVGNLTGMDSCVFFESDPAVISQGFWSGYQDASNATDDAAFAVPQGTELVVDPAQLWVPEAPLSSNGSPVSWCIDGSVSRTPSPVNVSEAWFASAQNEPLSPPHSSPEIACQSPSIDYISHHDVSGQGYTVSDAMPLANNMINRREVESARNHDLYKSAVTQKDGLYHCPWEGQPSCNHKPEKLKCNYDKFVDSHLKPYRCKDSDCKDKEFSSTACLLRHEREMHGMHGHGAKPHLCPFPGCERGAPGNGFPRHWNLKDHMERVHNHQKNAGANTSSSPDSSHAQPAKGRKRKTQTEPSRSISTRKTIQKIAPPKEVEKPAAKPLVEQWMDSRKAIEDMARSLENPEDARTVQQIADMQKLLGVMSQMSNTMAHGTLMPASRPMEFASSG